MNFQHEAERRDERPSSVASSASSFRIPGINRNFLRAISNPERAWPSARVTTPDALQTFAPRTPTNMRRETASSGDPFAGLLTASDESVTRLPPPSWLTEGPAPAAFIQQALTASPMPPALDTLPDLSQISRHQLDPFTARRDEFVNPAVRSRASPSRPFTASSYHRSRLMTADGSIGNYVSAILENRGIGHEVGIASIDRETGLCVITQIADTPTYVRTMHHLSVHPPSILLVPATALNSPGGTFSGSSYRSGKNSKLRRSHDEESEADYNGSASLGGSMLIRSLEELFEIQASPFPRKHWNYQEGARYLDKLLVDDVQVSPVQVEETERSTRPPTRAIEARNARPSSAIRPVTGNSSFELNAEASSRAGILVAVAKKYYLLSAVCALFDFFTETFNRIFTPRSLRIQYVVPEGTIMINSNTAHDLELVANLIDAKSKDSLYGLLNQCATPMGRRLLKTNILQPLTDRETIEARLDAVSECIRSEERFYAIRESMKPLRDGSVDLDKLIHSLSSKQKRASTERLQTERKISNVLDLRTLLRALHPARAALQGCSSGLLQAVHAFLSSEELDIISNAIETTINDDVVHAKGGLSSRNAKMYAVKAERSPLLDVARSTYRENINDIMELWEHGLTLTVKMITTGFLTKCESSQLRHLGDHFTNISRAKSGRNVTMMTLDLKKLNARLLDSMNEVCTISDAIIEELREEIVAHISVLFKVSEALSLLDIILSFAQVSISNTYVRPSFGPTFDIRNGRHPILDRVDSSSASSAVPTAASRRRSPFVPNDIYLSSSSKEKFCFITGPNLSGKSTFLRQVALITVMAGLGCFVPADRATLAIPDALLSLLTHEEDPAQNLSTFAAEMRTSAFILSVATPRSLIILDEMGRGTAPEEGIAIAASISEDLIEKKSTVFFATHFGDLVESFEGKDGVVCQHLQVSVDQQQSGIGRGRGETKFMFHHKVHLGVGLGGHYSLEVARMMGCFKTGFLQRAAVVAASERGQDEQSAEETESIRDRRRIVRKLAGGLRAILEPFHDEENSNDIESTLERMRELQRQAVLSLAESYDHSPGNRQI